MSIEIFVVAAMIACGVVGGCSVIGAVRWSSDRRAVAFQRLFTICLVGLGACTLFAVGQERSWWILGAFVFGLLSVAATAEIGNQKTDRVRPRPQY